MVAWAGDLRANGGPGSCDLTGAGESGRICMRTYLSIAGGFDGVDESDVSV